MVLKVRCCSHFIFHVRNACVHVIEMIFNHVTVKLFSFLISASV